LFIKAIPGPRSGPFETAQPNLADD
jgi:hypothetical protein